MNLKEIFNQAVTGPWQTEPSTDTQYKIEELNDRLFT